jgi:hypothetical protein
VWGRVGSERRRKGRGSGLAARKWAAVKGVGPREGRWAGGKEEGGWAGGLKGRGGVKGLGSFSFFSTFSNPFQTLNSFQSLNTSNLLQVFKLF